jgi:hypothetical protein
MSVLIKDIRIPESCAECRFCVNGFTDDAPMYECACQSYDNVSVLVDKDGQPFDFRPEWCPLIELPPHGRLIDADAFDERVRVAGGMSAEELTEDFKDGVQTVLYMMSKQPTIIEAEGSDT